MNLSTPSELAVSVAPTPAPVSAKASEEATAGAVASAPALAEPANAGLAFLNRELSWLEFNRRVLHEACDGRTPLLERVRFLGIVQSNLDEFFMKRVGGLKRQVAAGVRLRTPDGLTLPQQLAAIRQSLGTMLDRQALVFTGELKPALAREGIHLSGWEELNEKERGFAVRFFKENVFPVLTPLAVDPGHPFPFISNLSTSLGVLLRHPEREEELFARVKVPEMLPRWVRVDEDQAGAAFRFVSLLEIIRQNVTALFPSMRVLDVMPFRITRNAEMERDEADADDLLEMVEEELRLRRFAQVVRLEHGPRPNASILRLLMDELELGAEDVYEMPAELDYIGLAAIAGLEVAHLRYEPWTPMAPPGLEDADADIFGLIRAGDLLVHHPFESFGASVERFVQAAADDPRVLAIKVTIYRTGDDSPFLRHLIRAANAGKQVVCLVELKARFDEERNIYWAHVLEKAGIHVVYGIVGLKTHTKTALVIRQEAEGLRSYAHLGTGNYHVTTARLYTDLSLFTCRADLTEDLAELFNFLTGRSLKRDYKKLIVAPLHMKERFLAMLERETGHRRAGRPAYVAAKMNSLEDREICAALYRASGEGVSIDLLVRGLCCLKPGVPGLSERIRVRSVIGRFLEHSRLFYFRNGAVDPLDGEFYLGSADWMYRNLLARVETVAPIEARAHKEKCWELLQILLRDQRQTWELHPDGSYTQCQPSAAALAAQSPEALGAHQVLMNLARKSAQPGS